MVARCSVFVGTSLDVCIPRRDGSIDWLNEAKKSLSHEEDCGNSNFVVDVDALVMGRNTFEQVLGFDSWPYDSNPEAVLSHRGISLPQHLPPCVSVSNETPTALVARLSD